MAEQSGSSGGAAPWLAFLVGGLLVVVAVIGYFVWTGQSAPSKSLDVTVTAPQLPEAPKLPQAPAAPKTGD
jgi:zinc transporter ZupT